MDIDFVPSPNYSSRGGLDVVGTVIHYTADGPEWNPIRWLCMPEAQASAHYVIERDGDIARLVRLTKKAWHAGTSLWDYKGAPRRDVSAYTIGIELANCGLLVEEGGDFFWQIGRGDLRPYRGPDPVQAMLRYEGGQEVSGWWEPYDDRQMDSLQALLRRLAGLGYQDAVSNLVGHEEIAGPDLRPGRFKMDPGGVFPWDRFRRKTSKSTSSLITPSV